MKKWLLGAALALMAAPTMAQTGGPPAGPSAAQPAVQFDVGGRFDRSFNQAAYDGAERYKRETGQAYLEFEVQNAASREQGLRNLARRNPSVVVAVGFSNATAVETVAREFPNVRFTLIDAVVDLPNVQSITFREHEGSFLVGMVAALVSRTGRVGFVGGMDVPIIRRFARGYQAGARHANAQVEVFENMTGTTPDAFRDPTRGGELARGQMARGADVIFAAAGLTGNGVYQAVRDAGQGRMAIGVDSNQNYLHPGVMVTSMVKRVDVAVYNAFMAARNGTWRAGATSLGLAEDGVGWAIDEHNRAMISADVERRVNEARAAIIAGTVRVPDETTPR